MLLSTISQSRWVAAVIAVPLLVVGLYLSVVWFGAYVYGNVWDKGLLQNGISVVIGCFFALAWLGFLLSRKGGVVYWCAVTAAVIVVAVQIWHHVVGRILPLEVEVVDIAFALTALCLIVLVGSGRAQTN